MRELVVYFNGVKVENNMDIELKQVQTQPKIKFNIPANKYYTILMVDPDAPSATDPINKHWLHWMVMNNNETVINFQPSLPSKNSGKHRYYIYLLEQQNKIDKLPTYSRPKFSVEQFITKYKLKPIASFMYKTDNI